MEIIRASLFLFQKLKSKMVLGKPFLTLKKWGCLTPLRDTDRKGTMGVYHQTLTALSLCAVTSCD